MSELQHPHEKDFRVAEPGLFAGPPQEPPRKRFLMGMAGTAVLIAIVAGIFLLRDHHPPVSGALNAELPLDPYAEKLQFTQLAMSQSTSLSGGTSTFIDGHVRNAGGETITGVGLQVLFRNDEGLAPQVENIPLALIRIHQPYVDTEAVSAAPLKPGDDVEFRLIFESIPTNWNQQLPELRVTRVAGK